MAENKQESAHTVLIAEDEDISYMYLSNILKKASFKVLRAENGKEAVDICRDDENIDLVLMDINMPVMNGFEATALIKKIRQDLPVIAVTAYTLNNSEITARESGCDDYLPKPVMKDILLSTLNKYF